MTARSSGLLGLACVLVAVGCRREPEPKRLSDMEQQLERAVEVLASGSDQEERIRAAFLLGDYCCNYTRDEWLPELTRLKPRSCRALTRLLETERDPRVVNEALFQTSPRCQAEIPTKAILNICRAGCADTTQKQVNHWLGGVEPSPEVVQALLAQIDRLPRDAEREQLAPIFWALAQYGEAELSAVVEALSSPDLNRRDFAVSVLSAALSDGPLDLPDALEALDRASHDPYIPFAQWAETTAEAYRRWTREPAEATLRQWLAEGHRLVEAFRADSKLSEHTVPWLLSEVRIRMLAVRRAFCPASNVVPVLEQIAASADPQQAILARRALETRKKRCAAPAARP